MAEVLDTLKRVPLFAGLSDRELKRVAKSLQEREFAEGTEITTQDQSGVGFFVIDEGSADVKVGGQVVRSLGPGEYFGEIALIDNGPRSATVIATSALRCRGLTAWAFRPLVQHHPEMAWPILEALVARLREAEERPGT